MAREIDYAAKDIVVRRFVLPACLHVPIAAEDEVAIAKYIGEITTILVTGMPNKAFVVMIDPPHPPDNCLPIWKVPESAVLFEKMQVWVHVGFNGYRRAYKKARPAEDISNRVLSHCMNRRHADLKGFQYVRIVPATRSTNSSSAFSEEWGIGVNGKSKELTLIQQQSARIQYADLVDLMVMMDRKVGGGVMEIVNEAQKLITPTANHRIQK
jgi:predicted GIY-YIG superfamily endonuclease